MFKLPSNSLKPILVGSGVSVAALFVFGVLTSLIPNPLFARMIPPTTLDYLFLIATSLLVGAYVGLQAFDKQMALGKPRSKHVTAYSGMLGGILAFGCPLCNKLFVMALGSSTILTFIDPYRPLFGSLGVAALSLAVFVKAKTVSDGTCAAAYSKKLNSKPPTENSQ